MGDNTPPNSYRAAAYYRQAKAALKEAEFAVLAGDFARGMALAGLATAYGTLANYNGEN